MKIELIRFVNQQNAGIILCGTVVLGEWSSSSISSPAIVKKANFPCLEVGLPFASLKEDAEEWVKENIGWLHAADRIMGAVGNGWNFTLEEAYRFFSLDNKNNDVDTAMEFLIKDGRIRYSEQHKKFHKVAK